MRKITIQLARTRGVVFLLLFLIGGIFVRTSLPWGATKAEAGCGGASEIVFASSPGNTVLNSTFTLQVQVLDGCGEVLTTDNGRSITLSILSGPSGAVLSGTLTRTTSSGIASFPGLSLDTSGSYTIAAQTDSLGVTQTSAFPVFGEATKLAISSISPTSIRFGNPVTFTVTVQDASGATVLDSNGREISLAFGTHADGGIIDEGRLSQTSDGVASFSTTILGSAGTYSLIASSDGLTSIESNTFTLYGNASLITGVTNVSSASVGQNFTVTWTIRDSGGNVVSDDFSTPVTIAFHENSTGATLTIGTSNPRTTIGGQGIFSSLSIDRPGTYTFDLTSPGLTTGVSNSITITSSSSESTPTPARSVSSGGSGYVGGYVPGFTPSVSLAADMAKTIRESLLNVLAQTFYNDLSLGAQGDDVKYLQLFLVTKNTGPQARVLKTFGITPFFGPVTEAALKEFQKANNVPATGYFGPKTRAAAKGQ